MVKVYVELVFLDNFAINLILLFLCAALLNTRAKAMRLIAGGSFGAVYACCMLAYGGWLAFFPFKIALSFAVCCITFYKKGGLKTFVKSVICLYICTLATGGLVYVCLNASGRSYLMQGCIITGVTVFRYVLIGTAASILAFMLFRRAFSVKFRRGLTYEIRIGLLGRETVCRAYLDTGNNLKEPLSGLPVIVVEKDALTALMPREMKDALFSGKKSPSADKEVWRTRIRLLPCKGAAGNRNILMGFKPDSVRIREKDGEREIMAVIAVSPGCLSDTGSYRALFGPQLLV